MSGKNNAERYASLSVEQFQEQWAKKMVEIWTDRLIMLGGVRTGNLYRSVQRGATSLSTEESIIAFQFLQYGIYVDAGTGRGYKRGNGGDLYFLGKEYGTDYWQRAEEQADLSLRRRTIDKVITDCFEQIVYSINEYTGLFDSFTEK